MNVTDGEPQLLEDVRLAQTEAEGYRDLIDAFGANVSAAENVTTVLTVQVNDSHALLMKLQSLVRAIEVTLRVEVRMRLEEANELYQDYLIEVWLLVLLETAKVMSFSVLHSFCSSPSWSSTRLRPILLLLSSMISLWSSSHRQNKL